MQRVNNEQREIEMQPIGCAMSRVLEFSAGPFAQVSKFGLSIYPREKMRRQSHAVLKKPLGTFRICAKRYGLGSCRSSARARPAIAIPSDPQLALVFSI